MAAKFISRACEMAPYYAVVARAFVRVADALTDTPIFEHDDVMRTGGMDANTARQEALGKSTATHLLSDSNRATKLGYKCSAQDLITLDAMSGEDLLAAEDFSTVLPPAWR